MEDEGKVADEVRRLRRVVVLVALVGVVIAAVLFAQGEEREAERKADRMVEEILETGTTAYPAGP